MRRFFKVTAGFFIAVAMMVSVLGVLFTPIAEAACPNACDWDSGGRDYYHGYYDDQVVPGIGQALWVLNEAPVTVASADEFIAWMDPWINDNSNGGLNTHTAPASTMINLMLGRKGNNFTDFADGVAQARNSLSTWQQLVRAYEAAGNVQWNVPRVNCDPYDQTNMHWPTASVFYYTNLGGGCTTDPTIVFTNPETNATFAIKKVCGNIMGDANSLVLSTTLPPAPAPPPPPPSVPVQPIFKTSGGDVAAGASIATSTLSPCSAAPHTPGSGIASWNRRAAANYAGAGGEYAALAFGQVLDYATGQGTGVPPPANGLTFANVDTGNSVNLAAGVFGGLFTTAPCVDMWTSRPPNANLTNYTGGSVDSLDGNYRATSANSIVIPASTIRAGQHVTIYVTGNVSITGNITFENASWTNRRDIPSFKLVVLGTIFIDNSVTRLDGVYAAIPNDDYDTRNNQFNAPVAGTITTCANGFVSHDPRDFLTSNYRTECQTPLVINGAVIANQFWMLRLTQGLATDVPAEVVNYTPETWLSLNPHAPAALNGNYESIIGLPPIL